MNQTIYVVVDDQGFITDFKLTAAENYQEVTIPLAWTDAVVKYPTKFRVVDGTLKSPGNLPTVSTEDLKKQLDSANQIIADQNSTIAQLKALSGKLVGQQAELDATTTQLKTIAGQLTGQIASLNQGGK